MVLLGMNNQIKPDQAAHSHKYQTFWQDGAAMANCIVICSEATVI